MRGLIIIPITITTATPRSSSSSSSKNRWRVVARRRSLPTVPNPKRKQQQIIHNSYKYMCMLEVNVMYG